MTTDTSPKDAQDEALSLAHALDGGKLIDDSTEWADTLHASAAELRRLHAKVQELERAVAAEREACAATVEQMTARSRWIRGGINGEATKPCEYAAAIRARGADLDLARLTERGATAWAGVDAQALRDGDDIRADGPSVTAAIDADALLPVITWLDNGCEPARAAEELRLLVRRAAVAIPTSLNLACKSVQKRLATQWGYVPAYDAGAIKAAALASAAPPTSIGGRALRMVLQGMRHPAYPPYVNQFADAIENALASSAQPAAAPAAVAGPSEWREALEEALSVMRSVSMSRDRRVVREGCVLYLQTEEWCRWLEHEVGPKIAALLAAAPTTQAAPETREARGKRLISEMLEADSIATAACRQVAELPERSSPEDWPEAMLVTQEELHSIVFDAVVATQAAPTPSAQGDALDAARYRWLRQIRLRVGHGDIVVWMDDRNAGKGFQRHKDLWGEALDAAIDAARAAKEGDADAPR